jgi:predicted flap endonuclease-1-like 5' DNA nuclease
LLIFSLGFMALAVQHLLMSFRRIEQAAPSLSSPARYVPLAPSSNGQPDDLKLISGIGPATEEKLRRQGIFRFEDLASLDQSRLDDIRRAAGISPNLTEKYDWIGQARNLVAAKADS